MALSDGEPGSAATGDSRSEKILKLLDNEELVKELQSKHEVSLYRFDQTTEHVSLQPFISPEATEEETVEDPASVGTEETDFDYRKKFQPRCMWRSSE